MIREVVDQLAQTGVGVYPGFLRTLALEQVARDLNEVRAAGHFKAAGIGFGGGHARGGSVRNDETFWLDRELSTAPQKILWRRLDVLKRAINRSLFLGLTNFDGHYACYPAGGFYRRHLDAFKNNSERIVSVVIYLNRDWKEADGGQLRVFGKDSFRDIEPVGGTMVCFLSRESEHEVLLSHRDRFSFTGWFK